MNNKDKEKPSFLSKRVIKTQLSNEWENIRLHEELRQLNREKFNKNYRFIKTAQELHTRMTQIKQVKTSLSVSPERKIFIRKHGFSINVKEFDMDYFMDLIFDRTGSRGPKKTTSAPLIRVNDFMHDKEKREQERAIIEDDVILESIDVAPKRPESNKIPLHNAPTKKVRVIQPPLKGREIWKVHMERDRLERNPQEKEQNKEDLDKKVEAYRKKIVWKVEQSNSAMLNAAYRPHTSQTTRQQADEGRLLTSKFERKAVSARARLGNNNNSNYTHTSKNGDKRNQQNDQITNLAEQLPTLLIASPPANDERPLKKKISRTASSVDRLRVPSSSFLEGGARSARADVKRIESYSTMQIHVNGKTASLFVSKLK